MAWYKVGTITVTNGSPTVTGSGTQWIANAQVGEALYAPDGRLYEITNIASDTSFTITPAYLGTTQSGQTYTIVPSQSYIRDLAAQAADLVNQYSTIANFAGQGKFGDGTVTAPGIRFSDDLDTGLYRIGSNNLGISAGGTKIVDVSSSGVAITGTLSATGGVTLSGGTINNTPIGGTTPSTGAFTTVEASSTVSGTKLIPTGNVTAGNGMYLPASNVVAISTNGAERFRATNAGVQVTGLLSGTAVTQTATDTTANRLMKIGDFGVGSTGNGLNFSPLAFGQDQPTTFARWGTAPSGFGIIGNNATYLHINGVGDRFGRIFINSSTTSPNIYFQNASGSEEITPKTIYHTSNILSTVSQSGGVPTGGIIERGSNANGEFVRYADGTLICFARINLGDIVLGGTGAFNDPYRTDTLNATFPSSFVSASSISVSLVANLDDSVASQRWSTVAFRSVSTTGLSSLQAVRIGNNANSVDAFVNVTAIGRWF
jgi:hypothetical protein